jgi:predicted PurR-regulated permease PerM
MVDAQSRRREGLSLLARKVALSTTVVVIIFTIFAVVVYGISVFLLIFAGVLFAIMIRSIADWIIAKTGFRDGIAVGLVMLALVISGVAVILLAAPHVSDQLQELRNSLPESMRNVRDQLSGSTWGRWIIDSWPDFSDLEQAPMGQLVRRVGGFAYGAVNVIFGVVLVLFIAAYIAINPQLYIDGALRLVPASYRQRASQVMGAIGETLKWWLVASLIKMVLIGVLVFAGLWLLDVKLAFILALLAFALEFVPYVGPIAAAIPAVLIALIDGPTQALYVALLYLAVQQTEGLIISPIVFQRTVYLPPVVTLVAQILIGLFVGVLGIVLATPLATTAMVAIKMLWVEDVIGEDTDVPDKPVDSKTIPN